MFSLLIAVKLVTLPFLRIFIKMKRYSRVFRYLGAYKRSITWYFITIVLSILFSILSLGMLFPFLQLLFVKENTGVVAKASTNPVISWVNEQLSNLVVNGDPFYALGIVCVMILFTIFLKNLFIYLSYRVMGPVKNGIVNKFRVDRSITPFPPRRRSRTMRRCAARSSSSPPRGSRPSRRSAPRGTKWRRSSAPGRRGP